MHSPGKCSDATCSGLTSCMIDPVSVACTAVYGGSAALPSVIAGEWQERDKNELYALNMHLIVICTWYAQNYFFIGKCSEATCSGLSSCMRDPASAGCTAAYGGSAALPSVLAGKYPLHKREKIWYTLNVMHLKCTLHAPSRQMFGDDLLWSL